MTKTKRRSGGPRTTEGRARSSANATKHAMYSLRWRLPDEDGDELGEHVRGVFATLRPRGHAEAELARRVAFILWRMRRLERYEATACAYVGDCRVRMSEAPENVSRANTPNAADARRLACVPDGKVLDKTITFERHLQRQLDKVLGTLRELRRLG